MELEQAVGERKMELRLGLRLRGTGSLKALPCSNTLPASCRLRQRQKKTPCCPSSTVFPVSGNPGQYEEQKLSGDATDSTLSKHTVPERTRWRVAL